MVEGLERDSMVQASAFSIPDKKQSQVGFDWSDQLIAAIGQEAVVCPEVLKNE